MCLACSLALSSHTHLCLATLSLAQLQLALHRRRVPVKRSGATAAATARVPSRAPLPATAPSAWPRPGWLVILYIELARVNTRHTHTLTHSFSSCLMIGICRSTAAGQEAAARSHSKGGGRGCCFALGGEHFLTACLPSTSALQDLRCAHVRRRRRRRRAADTSPVTPRPSALPKPGGARSRRQVGACAICSVLYLSFTLPPPPSLPPPLTPAANPASLAPGSPDIYTTPPSTPQNNDEGGSPTPTSTPAHAAAGVVVNSEVLDSPSDSERRSSTGNKKMGMTRKRHLVGTGCKGDNGTGMVCRSPHALDLIMFDRVSLSLSSASTGGPRHLQWTNRHSRRLRRQCWRKRPRRRPLTMRSRHPTPPCRACGRRTSSTAAASPSSLPPNSKCLGSLGVVRCCCCGGVRAATKYLPPSSR